MIDRLLKYLRQRDIRVWVEEGRIRYDAAAGSLTPAVVNLLRAHREQIIHSLAGGPHERPSSSGHSADMSGDIWLRPLNAIIDNDVVVFVLPPAGAGPAIFWRWRNQLPTGIRIVLIHTPGREELIDEQPYTQVGPLADRLAEQIASYGDRPYALFGHSAGALIGYEVAKRINSPALRLLVVAAAVPPDRVADYSEADDVDLVHALANWGGTPEELLSDPNMYSVFLPCLRADLAVAGSCRKTLTDNEKLDIPIVALSGSQDRFAPFDECRHWSAWTNEGFAAHRISGDHFFPAVMGRAVLDVIASAVHATAPSRTS